MNLVDTYKDTHGLNACLNVFSLVKSTFYHRKQREKRGDPDKRIKAILLDLVRQHPDYGYRRLLPDVVKRMNEPVNHKRLRRLLKTYALSLPSVLPKHSPSPVRKILEQYRGGLDMVSGKRYGPLEVFSTDITELKYADGTRKAYLMAFVDIETKLAAGWAVPSRQYPACSGSLAERLRAVGAAQTSTQGPGRPQRPGLPIHQF